MVELLTFYGYAGLLVLSACGVIFAKRPMISSVALVYHLSLMAGLFALLGASFVGFLQLFCGALGTGLLFWFAICHLEFDSLSLKQIQQACAPIFLGGLITLWLIFSGFRFPLSTLIQDQSNQLALHLLGDHLWSFETLSLLILLTLVTIFFITPKRDSKDLSS